MGKTARVLLAVLDALCMALPIIRRVLKQLDNQEDDDKAGAKGEAK